MSSAIESARVSRCFQITQDGAGVIGAPGRGQRRGKQIRMVRSAQIPGLIDQCRSAVAWPRAGRLALARAAFVPCRVRRDRTRARYRLPSPRQRIARWRGAAARARPAHGRRRYVVDSAPVGRERLNGPLLMQQQHRLPKQRVHVVRLPSMLRARIDSLSHSRAFSRYVRHVCVEQSLLETMLNRRLLKTSVARVSSSSMGAMVRIGSIDASINVR